MIIYVDIDGTICTEVPDQAVGTKLENIELKKNYMDAQPFMDRIAYINSLYDKGHTVHYWTARGARSNINWFHQTAAQLESWGCKYHGLSVGTKPHFDAYICDKSFNADSWFRHQTVHKDLLV